MSIGQQAYLAAPLPRVEVAAGTGFDLLVGLARPPRDDLPEELRAALDDVGDTVGEVWLHLLGVVLDGGPPYSAERLGSALAAIDPVELRRHLLGRHAWSWCTLAGAEAIDAAAAGERSAFPALLGHGRYYAGHAADSLSVLLPLDPEETRRRVERVVGCARAIRRDETGLAEARRAATRTLASSEALDAIERLAWGYRYVPEPEAERVVLVPHLQGMPRIALTQHRDARLIVYSARAASDARDRLLSLGRSLADPKRIEILALLGRGVGRVADLVAETGLSRSTVHHHLAQLREAGLVGLEGNARAYRYVPRRGADAEAAALLAEVLG